MNLNVSLLTYKGALQRLCLISYILQPIKEECRSEKYFEIWAGEGGEGRTNETGRIVPRCTSIKRMPPEVSKQVIG